VRVEYPSYDGTGSIPVMVSVLIDPDGFVVELNQLLIDAPQAKPAPQSTQGQ
jgi:hypothetical protein